MNKSRRHLFLVIPLIILTLCGFVLFFNFQIISDYLVGAHFSPSAELSDIIADINLTDTGSRILNASLPELQDASSFNDSCSTKEQESSILGCYSARRVFVYDIDNVELIGIKQSVLAHELLHAVWDRLSFSKRQALEPALENAYLAHKDTLFKHMQNYEVDAYYDELHSVIGTQITSSDLPNSLRAHYDQIFRNQAQIVIYYEQYSAKFTALSARAATLATQIEHSRTQIDSQSAAYQAAATALDQDIINFNARANRGAFDATTFRSERAALLLRQSALEKQYQELNTLISETNQLIAEYNNNITRVNALYSSIDSKISAPASKLSN